MQCLTTFEKHNILSKTINLLYVEQNMKIIFNALEGSYALCLMANIVQLSYIERETTLKELFYPNLTVRRIVKIFSKLSSNVQFCLKKYFSILVCTDEAIRKLPTLCCYKTVKFNALASNFRMVCTKNRSKFTRSFATCEGLWLDIFLSL